jgi:hypothetical protein
MCFFVLLVISTSAFVGDQKVAKKRIGIFYCKQTRPRRYKKSFSRIIFYFLFFFAKKDRLYFDDDGTKIIGQIFPFKIHSLIFDLLNRISLIFFKDTQSIETTIHEQQCLKT